MDYASMGACVNLWDWVVRNMVRAHRSKHACVSLWDWVMHKTVPVYEKYGSVHEFVEWGCAHARK